MGLMIALERVTHLFGVFSLLILGILVSNSLPVHAATITEYSIPTAGSYPEGITAGPDGNLWFTESSPSKIGRITPTGTITEFSVTWSSEPQGITAGPDGNIWFTEKSGNRIGRITPTGTVTEFDVPTAHGYPDDITTGPDGNLWFTEGNVNKIGRITPTGAITVRVSRVRPERMKDKLPTRRLDSVAR
jgi:virginiamycin B lyase